MVKNTKVYVYQQLSLYLYDIEYSWCKIVWEICYMLGWLAVLL